MKILSTFLVFLAFFMGCNDSGTKVKPREVTATDTKPTPTPTPTATPVEDPNDLLVSDFFSRTGGQWLSKCVSNDADQTSILPGFKFDRREYLWIQYQYANTGCQGISDPRDGKLVYWLVEKVEVMSDGWFQITGNCNSAWACQNKKQTVLLKETNGSLFVRELKDPAEPEAPVLELSNGPSK